MLPGYLNAPIKFIINAARENTYSALIAAASLAQGGNRPLSPQVEYAQFPRDRNPLFNDSHYFNFFDQEQKIGGFTRIGKLPNQNTVNGFFFIFIGGEALMFNQDESIPPGFKDIRCGSLHYEVVEPLQRLRLLVNGQFLRLKNPRELFDMSALLNRIQATDYTTVDVALDFTGWGVAHNFKKIYARGLARRMVEKNMGLRDLMEARKVTSEHYEQVGSYNGTLNIGGQKIIFDGAGHRDHSWGPRDMTAPTAWTWLTMQFGREASLNLTRYQGGNLDVFTGYINRGDRNYPFRRYHLETEFEADGLTQKRLRFIVEDTGGFRMEVEGEVLTPVPVVLDDGVNRAVVIEAMTEYHWQGRRTYGIAEYMHKLR